MDARSKGRALSSEIVKMRDYFLSAIVLFSPLENSHLLRSMHGCLFSEKRVAEEKQHEYADRMATSRNEKTRATDPEMPFALVPLADFATWSIRDTATSW
jgi:hypothetical protein